MLLLRTLVTLPVERKREREFELSREERKERERESSCGIYAPLCASELSRNFPPPNINKRRQAKKKELINRH